MSFLLENSSRPKRPSSRPIPEFFTPHLIEEAARSTMDELAGWTVESDQVLTF